MGGNKVKMTTSASGFFWQLEKQVSEIKIWCIILLGTKFCKTIREEIRLMQTAHPNVHKLSNHNLIFPAIASYTFTGCQGSKLAPRLLYSGVIEMNFSMIPAGKFSWSNSWKKN